MGRRYENILGEALSMSALMHSPYCICPHIDWTRTCSLMPDRRSSRHCGVPIRDGPRATSPGFEMLQVGGECTPTSLCRHSGIFQTFQNIPQYSRHSRVSVKWSEGGPTEGRWRVGGREGEMEEGVGERGRWRPSLHFPLPPSLPTSLPTSLPPALHLPSSLIQISFGFGILWLNPFACRKRSRQADSSYVFDMYLVLLPISLPPSPHPSRPPSPQGGRDGEMDGVRAGGREGGRAGGFES